MSCGAALSAWRANMRRVLARVTPVFAISASSSSAASVVAESASASSSASASPRPQLVSYDDACRLVIDELRRTTLADIGLSSSSMRAAFHCGRVAACDAPRVHYHPLLDAEAYSVGVFVLDKDAVMPLHNHPGMHVFSRVLYGRMRVRSFSLLEPCSATQADCYAPRRATADGERAVASPEVLVVRPQACNVHEFVALDDCAVLDVISPPYSSTRPCVYYGVQAHADAEQHVTLVPRGEPADFFVRPSPLFRPQAE